MEKKVIAPCGMVVTPHHLASQSAIAILKEGGTAMEAMVAAAATIAVVYPHMNSIGGDGFWLILPPNGDPVVIEACGVAGSLAKPELYPENKIPTQGPKAAITVAGTIAGWQEALNYTTECGYKRLSAKRLLADAIQYAEDGFPVSSCQVEDMKTMEKEGTISDDVKRFFFINGKIPEVGQRLKQPELARTLKHLANNGFRSFYRDELAEKIAKDMESLGVPITKADLENHQIVRKKAVSLELRQGRVYNSPPPTQGLASLAILGILDRIEIDYNNEAEVIHKTVEATKQANWVRDNISDPRFMKKEPQSLISFENLYAMARKIRDKATTHQGKGDGPGDTVWMGAIDKRGFSVSFIQSIYWSFGSGVVLPTTGILWQNRGISFTLDGGIRSLVPGKKPFHTLNPAAARLRDGRTMVYGTRGGESQPQIQAQIFQRYANKGMGLQESVSAPRWVFERRAKENERTLMVEGRFCEETIEDLRKRGHTVQMLSDFCPEAGQAGALVRHDDGMIEGAFDPRSDGSVVGF